MMILTPRWFFAATALLCAALLGYGYYLEFHDGLEPCPMCIFQRLCFVAILVIGVLGAVHGPRRAGIYAYGSLTTVVATIGASIAARQVWLQHLPADRVPECGPGLEFMLEVYPLFDVIRTALKGTGECAAVDWTFLGASIAEWSLLCFLGIAATHCAFMAHRLRRGPATR